MTTAKSSPGTEPITTVELSPNYVLPLAFILAGIPLVLVQRSLGAVIALFGFFLLYQAATIRLQFTPTALEVYRSGQQIRHFPYAEWINWRIFWQQVPILFYFREVKSIHFLPILFDPATLRACLEQRCPVK